MKFRRLVAVPFVALALMGCGSESDGGGATTPAGATVITAIDGIAWDAATYAAAAANGKVTIALQNDSVLPHDLRLLDADSVDVGLKLVVQFRGEVDTLAYTLAPGTYQVICTLAGHGNMKASLTVS